MGNAVHKVRTLLLFGHYINKLSQVRTSFPYRLAYCSYRSGKVDLSVSLLFGHMYWYSGPGVSPCAEVW